MPIGAGPRFCPSDWSPIPSTANLSVLNMGIAGNRVLGDGAGVAALARFDRDVLSQSGVKWLMILEGINDMNLAGRGGATAGLPP